MTSTKVRRLSQELLRELGINDEDIKRSFGFYLDAGGDARVDTYTSWPPEKDEHGNFKTAVIKVGWRPGLRGDEDR